MYYPSIFWKRLRNTTKYLSHVGGWDLNKVPPKFELDIPQGAWHKKDWWMDWLT